MTTAVRRKLKEKGYVGLFVGKPVPIHRALQPLPREQVPLQLCTAEIFGACEIFFFFRYVGLNVSKKEYGKVSSLRWPPEQWVGGWDGVLFWVGQTVGEEFAF